MKAIVKIVYPAVGLLALGCFGLTPLAEALVPPPDGGYPGGNTAEGQDALFNLSSGTYNTAIGLFSQLSETTASLNTAIGAATLLSNIGDANTATGAGALLFNTTGFQNTANGAFALFSNITGGSNTASGFDALFNNTEGAGNTANGAAALFSNTTGSGNTAVGAGALFGLSAGTGNTAVGVNANINGINLENNTIVGANAEGGGDGVTVIGANAFGGLIQNTVVGFQAYGGDTGNTVIGAGAGSNLGFASFVICIGADGQNVDNSCYIGNIWNQPGGSQAVYVNSDGKLGFQTSSRRFKDQIKPIDKSSEAIYALQPVSFRYKPEIEPTRPRGFGLIAEDVQKVNRDLVMHDAEGKPASVRYEAVNAMLLNEFLKEHKKIEELHTRLENQEAAIAELKLTRARQQKRLEQQQARIEALTTGLQKVTAQLAIASPSRAELETRNTVRRTALNH